MAYVRIVNDEDLLYTKRNFAFILSRINNVYGIPDLNCDIVCDTISHASIQLIKSVSNSIHGVFPQFVIGYVPLPFERGFYLTTIIPHLSAFVNALAPIFLANLRIFLIHAR